MPWKPVEGDPFADEQNPVAGVRDEGAEQPGLLSRVARGARDLVTGEDRTEFPEAPEFLPTYANSRGPGGTLPDLGSATSSAITPDPEAQFDILSKSIPGLQRKTDKFGNMMLKAPGVDDWTYLNKPGASARDLDEFGTQTLATAPFLGWMGKAGGALATVGRGLVGGTAASVAQDAAAISQGSEQGVDGTRAAVSGALGAAVPAVLPVAKALVGGATGAGSAAKHWVGKYTDPEGYARKEVQGAFAEDAAQGGVTNLSQAERQTAAARGQDLRAMDYGGGTVQDVARKAANQSGAAKDMLMRVIGPRWQGQTGRTVGVLQNEMGFDRSVKEVGDQLMQKARQARQPLYDQAYRDGADGVSSPALDQLASSPLFARAMQRANVTMQDRAAIPGLFTTGTRSKKSGQYTLEYWDQVKQRLDDMHSAAKRSGANAKALDIDRMRRALRDELDTAVPRYRSARSTAEAYFDAGDALEAGEKFAKGTFDLKDAAANINMLNPQEKALFNEGFARSFINDVRRIPDRSNILNRINSSEMEKERLKLGLGGGRAAQLEAFLRIEQMMDAMRNAMGNSTTARQLTQLASSYGIPALIGGVGYAVNDPNTMLVAALMGGGKLAQMRVDRRVAEHVAEMLTSKDPDIFLNGLKQASQGPVMEALRAIDNAISQAGVYRAAGQQTAVNSSQEADPQSEREQRAFEKARAALGQGADRTAVMKRLRDSGVNPRGL